MNKQTLRIILVVCISVCVLATAFGTIAVILNTDNGNIAAEPTKGYKALLYFTPAPLLVLAFTIFTAIKSKNKAASSEKSPTERVLKPDSEDDDEDNHIKPTLLGATVFIATTTLCIMLLFGCITFINAPKYSHDTEYIKTIEQTVGFEFPETAEICTSQGRSNAYFSIVKQSGIRFTDKAQTDKFTQTVKDSELWINGKESIVEVNTILRTIKSSSSEYLYYCAYNKTRGKFNVFPDFRTQIEELIVIEYDVISGDTWIYEIQTFIKIIEETSSDDKNNKNDNNENNTESQALSVFLNL